MKKIYHCANGECGYCSFDGNLPCPVCGDIVKPIPAEKLTSDDYRTLFCESSSCLTDEDQISKQKLEVAQAWADTGDPEGQLLLARFGANFMEKEKVFYLTCLAADRQYPDALADLGMMYFLGWGTKEDHQKADKCFRAAIEKDSDIAKLYLAQMRFDDPDKIDEALVLLNDVHENSEYSGVAAYYLGKVVEELENYESAKKCVIFYEEAAYSGFPPAMCELGRQYDTGNFVPRDTKLARIWYSRAIKENQTKAFAPMLRLLYHETENEDRCGNVLNALNHLAECGDPEAAIAAAEIYEDGIKVSKDMKKAYHLYEIAANFGDEDGKIAQAALLAAGDGAEQNIEKAKELIAGLDENDLGVMFVHGLIAEAEGSIDEAISYYNETVNLAFYPEASYHLGKILMDRGEDEEALEAFKDAAVMGHRDSILALISYYKRVNDKKAACMYKNLLSQWND